MRAPKNLSISFERTHCWSCRFVELCCVIDILESPRASDAASGPSSSQWQSVANGRYLGILSLMKVTLRCIDTITRLLGQRVMGSSCQDETHVQSVHWPHLSWLSGSLHTGYCDCGHVSIANETDIYREIPQILTELYIENKRQVRAHLHSLIHLLPHPPRTDLTTSCH